MTNYVYDIGSFITSGDFKNAHRTFYDTLFIFIILCYTLNSYYYIIKIVKIKRVPLSEYKLVNRENFNTHAALNKYLVPVLGNMLRTIVNLLNHLQKVNLILIKSVLQIITPTQSESNKFVIARKQTYMTD